MTLDDQTILEAARSDPVAFVRWLDRAIIDEVQRVPNLIPVIKKSIDDNSRPRRFLLTGSTNVMTLPRVADSLASQIDAIRMLPFARSEILGGQSKFLEAVSAQNLASPKGLLIGGDLIDMEMIGAI